MEGADWVPEGNAAPFAAPVPDICGFPLDTSGVFGSCIAHRFLRRLSASDNNRDLIPQLARIRMKSVRPRRRSIEAWEREWQGRWSKSGGPSYELPADATDIERKFLAETRTPEKEAERLRRIQAEFVRGFKGLYRVGPAVTVFGSARFKENHRYYKLARSVGSELARAGFATLTGGGPGIMEAANRGAHEAGGHSYGLNIILPHEQCENPYVDKSIEFRYFFTRKVCLVKYSCAFIRMSCSRHPR
jgi:hypothetical protein